MFALMHNVCVVYIELKFQYDAAINETKKNQISFKFVLKLLKLYVHTEKFLLQLVLNNFRVICFVNKLTDR